MNIRRRQRTRDFTFGTWKVQTMLQPGKTMEIADNVSTDLRKDWNKRMERQSEGSRGLEAYCKGCQGPPGAAAPPKKKKKWPRGLRRRSAAALLLVLWVRIPQGCMDVSLLWVLCVVRYRSLRRADHSSRGAPPTVVRGCMWTRNLVNEEAMAHWGGGRGAVVPK